MQSINFLNAKYISTLIEIENILDVSCLVIGRTARLGYVKVVGGEDIAA
jgi:hypothetical protein